MTTRLSGNLASAMTPQSNPDPRLYNLIRANDYDGVEAFLPRGNEESKENAVKYQDEQGRTALYCACMKPDEINVHRIIKKLIERGEEAKEILLLKTNKKPSTDDVEGGKQQHLYGATALHAACYYGNGGVDNEEVVKCLLEAGGKQLVNMKDEKERTALHYACESSKNNVQILKDLYKTGGKDLLFTQEENDRTVLHHACREGSEFDIIEFLVREGGKELVMKKENRGGLTALHVLRGKSITANYIDLFTEVGGLDLLKAKSKEQTTPLEFWINRDIISIVAMKTLMAKWIELDPKIESIPKEKIVTGAFQKLLQCSEEHLSLVTETDFAKKILNSRMTQKKAMAILLIDIYVQIVSVALVSFGELDKCTSKEGYAFGLSLCVIWFTARELIQLATTPLKRYVVYPDNYFDIAQIVLLTALISKLSWMDGYGCSEINNHELLVVATVIGWAKLLITLSYLSFHFSVFVAALFSIASALIPFILTSVMFIMAFAHGYHNARSDHDQICTFPFDFESEWLCRLSDSYFRMSSTFFTQDYPYLDTHDTTPSVLIALSFLFAFFVGILLLNILIAKICNVYAKVEEEGAKAFWLNRLDFIIQVESIFCCFGFNDDGHNGTPTTSPTSDSEGTPEVKEGFSESSLQTSDSEGTSEVKEGFSDFLDCRRIHFSRYFDIDYDEEIEYKDETEKAFLRSYFRYSDKAKVPNLKLTHRVYLFLKWAKFHEILLPGEEFEKVILGLKQKEDIMSKRCSWMFVRCFVLYPWWILVTFICIVWFLLGVITFGLLWPMPMKKYLFDEKGGTGTTETDEAIAAVQEKVQNLNNDLNQVQSELFNLREKQDDILVAVQKLHSLTIANAST